MGEHQEGGEVPGPNYKTGSAACEREKPIGGRDEMNDRIRRKADAGSGHGAKGK